LVFGAAAILSLALFFMVYQRKKYLSNPKKGHVPIDGSPDIQNSPSKFLTSFQRIFGGTRSVAGSSRIPDTESSIASLRQITSDIEVSTIIDTSCHLDSFGDDSLPHSREFNDPH
jgi:hypothetical protein